MQERRVAERFDVTQKPDQESGKKNAIELLDAKTGKSLGFLEDISVYGMKLIGTGKIESRKLMKLQIKLSEPIDGQDKIELTAKSLWSSCAERAGFFRTGFHILTLEDQNMILFEQLLDGIAAAARRTMANELK